MGLNEEAVKKILESVNRDLNNSYESLNGYYWIYDKREEFKTLDELVERALDLCNVFRGIRPVRFSVIEKPKGDGWFLQAWESGKRESDNMFEEFDKLIEKFDEATNEFVEKLKERKDEDEGGMNE